MSYFHKFVEFSEAMFKKIAENYLPLLQQIANLLIKISLVGTLLYNYFTKNIYTLVFLGNFMTVFMKFYKSYNTYCQSEAKYRDVQN